MKKKIIFLLLMFLIAESVVAQAILSLQESLDMALENSPQIKQAEFSLERSKQSLKAQRAALKSNFSLNLNAFDYSHDRRFDRFNNIWFTSENQASSADFRVVQPIAWTDRKSVV